MNQYTHRTDVQPLNKDKLYMLPRDRAAVVAHETLDPINSRPAHEQLAGVALLFAVLCSRFNVDPEDMHTFAKRLLDEDQQFHRKGNAQMDALIAYANLQKTGQVHL